MVSKIAKKVDLDQEVYKHRLVWVILFATSLLEIFGHLNS